MSSERDYALQLVRDAGKPSLNLQEFIALGLLVTRKWDKAIAANPAVGPSLGSQQAARYDSFTRTELSEFEDAANRALLQHVADLSYKKDKWSRGFWQSFWASFAYSLFLLSVAIIIKLFGSDLLTVLHPLIIKLK